MQSTVKSDKEIVYRYAHTIDRKHFREFHGKRIPSVILFQAKEFIPLEKIKIEVEDKAYGLHPDFRMYFEPILDELEREFSRNYYNNPLAKYLNFTYDEKRGKGTLKIARSYFYYEWLVHLNPDRVFYNSSYTFRDIFDPILINEINNNGANLESSPLPNTLGVNSLIFTQDGYIIVQRRSQLVVVEKQSFSVSFGGVFKWDFNKNDWPMMIAQVISENMEKELDFTMDPEDIYEAAYIMGIDRSLKYFGKPDIYVFTPIQETLKELEIKRNIEVEDFVYVKIAKNINQILEEPIRVRSRLTTSTDNLVGNVSLHLKIALDMLDKILIEVTPL